ncbi:MAG: hypothetical protein KL787_11205 [Taibaiella sp.]|nr:hypothetical protein [Taibaiella sp.]
MRPFVTFLVLLFVFLIHYTGYGQVQVGSEEVLKIYTAGDISKSEFERFRKTTTLFTLQSGDYDDEAEFRKAIEKFWTVTPFRIISPKEVSDFANKPGYSFCTFGGFMFTKHNYGKGLDHQYMYFTYDLWMPHDSRPKGDRSLMARIFLFGDVDAYMNSVVFSYQGKKNFSTSLTQYMYNDALLYNWQPGILAGYLKEINDYMISGETKQVYDELKEKAPLKSLAKDTLYIPDYVNIQLNIFTGAEDEKEHKDEELTEAYKYPVRFVSQEELNKMILDQSRSIKYLVYAKCSTTKWISIYDSGTGQLLYSEHYSMAYNFRKKDLKKIAKLIR